jgi:hypothetical protein
MKKAGTPLRDGALLALAEKEFDVLITIDSSMEFQQNIPKFRIGVIIVHVPKNQLAHYRAPQKELLLAVEKAQAGKVIHVRTPSA